MTVLIAKSDENHTPQFDAQISRVTGLSLELRNIFLPISARLLDGGTLALFRSRSSESDFIVPSVEEYIAESTHREQLEPILFVPKFAPQIALINLGIIELRGIVREILGLGAYSRATAQKYAVLRKGGQQKIQEMLQLITGEAILGTKSALEMYHDEAIDLLAFPLDAEDARGWKIG